MTTIGVSRDGRDVSRRTYIRDLREGPNEPGDACPVGSQEAVDAIERAKVRVRKQTRNHKARYGLPDDDEDGGDGYPN